MPSDPRHPLFLARLSAAPLLTPTPAPVSAPQPPIPAPPRLPRLPPFRTVDVVGTGTVAPPVCVATVNYTGSQHGFPPDAAAVVFDASSRHGKPLAFSIGRRRVIRGWDQGVPGMAVGGVRRLIIPSSMGYGPRGAGSIPGGATLYFTIELVDVSVAPKA